jgi:small conductance mechanosensitive channel
MILQECGVNLTAYLASASVIALAVSFGSQGLVQDVVIGLTLIFSDTMAVGEMVEIAGVVVVVGRVEDIGLRFTKLVNIYNQTIYIPNRTIANVSRFADGGVFAYADIQLPQSIDQEKADKAIEVGAQSMWGQFNAIILAGPTVGPVQLAYDGGWSFVRVRFKIWPGQGNLIETIFRQEMVRAMKAFDPNYAEWQVAVTYRTLTTL